MGKKKNRKRQRHKTEPKTKSPQSQLQTVPAEKPPFLSTNTADKPLASQQSRSVRQSTAIRWLAPVAIAVVAFYIGQNWKVISNFFAADQDRYLALLVPIPAIIVAVIALIIAKLFYQGTVAFKLGAALYTDDNPAVGLSLAGYLLAVGLVLIGITAKFALVFSQWQPVWPLDNQELVDSGLYFVTAILLLRLSGVIHDKLLLYKFSVTKEIGKDRNLGTGAVCCGAFIATGLILMSSFIGESGSTLEFLASILSAYFIGQILFIVGGILFQKATSYDIHFEIGNRDNAAAGVLFGSFLLGLGLVISATVTGVNIPASSWWQALLSQAAFSAIAGIIGIVLLLSAGIIVAKLLFPRMALDEEICQKNVAIALVIAAIYIGLGFIIRVILHP